MLIRLFQALESGREHAPPEAAAPVLSFRKVLQAVRQGGYSNADRPADNGRPAYASLPALLSDILAGRVRASGSGAGNEGDGAGFLPSSGTPAVSRSSQDPVEAADATRTVSFSEGNAGTSVPEGVGESPGIFTLDAEALGSDLSFSGRFSPAPQRVPGDGPELSRTAAFSSPPEPVGNQGAVAEDSEPPAVRVPDRVFSGEEGPEESSQVAAPRWPEEGAGRSRSDGIEILDRGLPVGSHPGESARVEVIGRVVGRRGMAGGADRAWRPAVERPEGPAARVRGEEGRAGSEDGDRVQQRDRWPRVGFLNTPEMRPGDEPEAGIPAEPRAGSGEAGPDGEPDVAAQPREGDGGWGRRWGREVEDRAVPAQDAVSETHTGGAVATRDPEVLERFEAEVSETHARGTVATPRTENEDVRPDARAPVGPFGQDLTPRPGPERPGGRARVAGSRMGAGTGAEANVPAAVETTGVWEGAGAQAADRRPVVGSQGGVVPGINGDRRAPGSEVSTGSGRRDGRVSGEEARGFSPAFRPEQVEIEAASETSSYLFEEGEPGADLSSPGPERRGAGAAPADNAASAPDTAMPVEWSPPGPPAGRTGIVEGDAEDRIATGEPGVPLEVAVPAGYVQPPVGGGGQEEGADGAPGAGAEVQEDGPRYGIRPEFKVSRPAYGPAGPLEGRGEERAGGEMIFTRPVDGEAAGAIFPPAGEDGKVAGPVVMAAGRRPEGAAKPGVPARPVDGEPAGAIFPPAGEDGEVAGPVVMAAGRRPEGVARGAGRLANADVEPSDRDVERVSIENRGTSGRSGLRRESASFQVSSAPDEAGRTDAVSLPGEQTGGDDEEAPIRRRPIGESARPGESGQRFIPVPTQSADAGPAAGGDDEAQPAGAVYRDDAGIAREIPGVRAKRPEGVRRAFSEEATTGDGVRQAAFARMNERAGAPDEARTAGREVRREVVAGEGVRPSDGAEGSGQKPADVLSRRSGMPDVRAARDGRSQSPNADRVIRSRGAAASEVSTGGPGEGVRPSDGAEGSGQKQAAEGALADTSVRISGAPRRGAGMSGRDDGDRRPAPSGRTEGAFEARIPEVPEARETRSGAERAQRVQPMPDAGPSAGAEGPQSVPVSGPPAGGFEATVNGMHQPAGGSAADGISAGTPAGGPADVEPSGGAAVLSAEELEQRYGITNQVVRSARLLSRSGSSEVTLRLDPPELGEVTIRLVSADRVVSGEISVENRRVHEAVTRHLADLRQALAGQGVQVERIEVSVGDRGVSPEDRDASSAFGRERPGRSFAEENPGRRERPAPQWERRPRRGDDGRVDFTA